MSSSESSSDATPKPRQAWVWLTSVPIFIVLGLLVGYVIQGSLEDDSTTQRSFVADLIVAAVMLAIWLTPCLLALSAARSDVGTPPRSARTAVLLATALAVLACAFLGGQVLYNLAAGLYG
ncbi:MAG: hypothetical protein WBA72_05620 [Ornithinimicrobium sp.]